MIKVMIKKYNNFLLKHFGHDYSAITWLNYAVRGVLDYIIYGSTVTDYFELTFYKKSHFEKKKYMTFRDSKKFVYAFDDNDKGMEFSRKTVLYENFKFLMDRKQLVTKKMSFEDFAAFCSSNHSFLFKPDSSSCGRGIEKYDVKSIDNLGILYETLRLGGGGVLDSLIYQHRAMESLHKESLNTIRVFAFRKSGSLKTSVIAAVLRMGRDGSFVDNYSAGGVVAPIDVKAGVVTASAEDIYGKRFAFHPTSNAQIVGFRIPNWDKVINLVKEAMQISTVSYVGWDVAIRDNDCVLVEGNYIPMVNVIQTADGGGKKLLYQKLIEQNYIK